MGGSAVGVDVGEGITDKVVVEGFAVGCVGTPVEGPFGVSVELVVVVMLLAAVEVDGCMLVTSLAQLLLVGPAHERTPNKKHI